eukprot:scaffold10272_cov276-Chaetoceros_neogracile.AAC.17
MKSFTILISFWAGILPVQAFLSILNVVKKAPQVPMSAMQEETGADISQVRRDLFQVPLQLALWNLAQTPQSVHALVAEKVKPKLTEEEGEAKFIEGYKTVCYLIDHYDEIREGGGDTVRRQLGTIVGNPPSGLVGISKAMKALEDRADDFIEYTETSDEVIKTINQADSSAYMSIFVGSSSSSTPPKQYFDDALIEIKRCKKTMEDLAKMVNVKL